MRTPHTRLNWAGSRSLWDMGMERYHSSLYAWCPIVCFISRTRKLISVHHGTYGHLPCHQKGLAVVLGSGDSRHWSARQWAFWRCLGSFVRGSNQGGLSCSWALLAMQGCFLSQSLEGSNKSDLVIWYVYSGVTIGIWSSFDHHFPVGSAA